MDDALAGTRVLIAGGEPDDAKALGASLAAAAAQVTVAPDAEAAAQAALAARPDVVVAIGAAEAELRDLLDPLELRSGPPLIAAAALDPPKGKLATAARLRALLDRAALDRRVRDVESALAAQTVARRRDLESARIEMLRRLALAAEYRDDNTPEHMERVAALAARLGQRVGLSVRPLTPLPHRPPLDRPCQDRIPPSVPLQPGPLSPGQVAG